MSPSEGTSFGSGTPKPVRIDGRRLRSERTRQLIIEAYLALIRENPSTPMPTAQEIALANELMLLRQDPAKALEDVWWAVLNSGEFILNH